MSDEFRLVWQLMQNARRQNLTFVGTSDGAQKVKRRLIVRTAYQHLLDEPGTETGTIVTETVPDQGSPWYVLQ